MASPRTRCNPQWCKAIASARLENDKAGAAILAQLLRAELLPEAWIAPPAVRQRRTMPARPTLKTSASAAVRSLRSSRPRSLTCASSATGPSVRSPRISTWPRRRCGSARSTAASRKRGNAGRSHEGRKHTPI
jgi:hypothetical protein